MIDPFELLTTLYHEADEAVTSLAAANHTAETIEYWKGRRDGVAYAIRELQQAIGGRGGEDFLSAFSFRQPDGSGLDKLPDGSVRFHYLGAQLERDHDKHRTVESDRAEDR